MINDGRDLAVLQTMLDANHLHLFVGELDGGLVATCYLNLIPNLTRNASPCQAHVLEPSATRHSF